MTMTHVQYTDPAIMVPGMSDGLNSWMPLSDDQRHGWACVACGRNAHGMRPVGSCEDGQVFLCIACHDLWASDVPQRAREVDPLGTPRGFTYVSTCAHCGQPVERVIGESHWSHIDSQVTRCPAR
jgi:hypothetical protein